MSHSDPRGSFDADCLQSTIDSLPARAYSVAVTLAERVDRRTLQQQVLMNLRLRLAQGEIAPGLRIVEAAESERLGVSRGTVREALRQLEQEGLIVRSPRRDVHVRELTSQEIVDLYAVRGALESLAIRAVCGLAEKPFVRAVRELRRQLVALESASGTSEEIASDLGFHETLCEASNNGILLVHWRQVAALLRNLLMSGRASLVLALPAHHRRLLAQIERRDAASAVTVLLEGFNRSRNDLVHRRQTLNRQGQER
jgi:DNA-binding GntR family transcriptional regulator